MFVSRLMEMGHRVKAQVLFPAETGSKGFRLAMATFEAFAESDEKFAKGEQQSIPPAGIVCIIGCYKTLPVGFGNHFPLLFLDHPVEIIRVHVISPFLLLEGRSIDNCQGR